MQNNFFRVRKPRKKRKNFLCPDTFEQQHSSSSRNLSGKCGFAFFVSSVGLCADPVLLICPAKGKGCSSSLCRSWPHQIGTCSFPPHQCWSTSSCPYAIPQKEKHRIEWFWQSLCPTFCGLCYDTWLEWVSRKAKQQHLFIVSELSSPTFLFMSQNTTWQPTWIRN